MLKLLESSISALEYEGSVAISARKNAASGKGRETENTKVSNWIMLYDEKLI